MSRPSERTQGRRVRIASEAAIVGALCLVVAGCRDDTGGSTGAFCDQVEDQLDELRAIPQTPTEVDTLIALWKEVGEDVPLSIEPDWQAHILMFETAWDPAILDDEDAAEEAYARIYATERSSVALAAWVNENCGFDWGAVVTIVPQVTTTTLAPGATIAPTTSTTSAATTTTVAG